MYLIPLLQCQEYSTTVNSKVIRMGGGWLCFFMVLILCIIFTNYRRRKGKKKDPKLK